MARVSLSRSPIKRARICSEGIQEVVAWAEIGRRLGRKALQEVACVAKPDTILAWYRRLIAEKFDGSKHRQYPGRPPISSELEALVVRMARENSGWGYDRIVGALANLGHHVSDQTVGNILRRHGIGPAPKRSQITTCPSRIRKSCCDRRLIQAATMFLPAVGSEIYR
jgi:hypothetical protein